MSTNNGTRSNWRHFFTMTKRGQEEEASLPCAGRHEKPSRTKETGIFAQMKRRSLARMAAEEAATNNKTATRVSSFALGLYMLCASPFTPVTQAKADAPDPALNQAFAACMAHEGYPGGRLIDVTPTMVQFATENEGPLFFDLAANKLTGKVWAWGENKQQFQIDYNNKPTDSVMPDTPLHQGAGCFRRIKCELSE